MAAGALLFDEDGRILLVEPTYKPYWEIPGGVVEADESPHTAACRELKEELGLVRSLLPLLTVDWVPPHDGRPEAMLFVFDGGEMSAEEIAGITVPSEELHGWRFCTPAEAAQLLKPAQGRRVAASLDARAANEVVYLENASTLDSPGQQAEPLGPKR
nr:NUDIX hydrolase [Actinopolymorpha pittospori]